MNNVLTCPCGAMCDSLGYAQERGCPCRMDNSVLMQIILEVYKEILLRSGHGRALDPHPARPMAGIQTDIDAQYLYPSTSHTMTYPPAFNTEESFMLSETHALMGRMQNAHLTRPNLSTEIWAADGGAAFSAQYGQSAPYNASTSWSTEGYACAPQKPSQDEDVPYTEEHGDRFDFETSFYSPALGPDPNSNPVPSISVTEHLEQGTFSRKQPVEGKLAAVDFNGGLGVSLGSLDKLADGGGPAFDEDASIGEKALIRFKLPQLPEHSTRQVRVRHGNRPEGRPITRREMAEKVFDKLRKLMDDAGKCGNPLQHQGSAVDIEKVVLLRVDHVSKGSVQPILGIRKNG